MSRLEEETKPLLSTLVDGRRYVFDLEEQRKLALWASKSACIAEQVFKTPTISKTDRQLIFAGEVPPTWQILLFPYKGGQYSELYCWQHVGTIVERKEKNVHDHHIVGSFWGLGHSIVYLLASSWEEAGERLEKLSLPSRRRIWPPHRKSQFWNLDHTIDDAQATSFMDIFDRLITVDL